MFFLVISFKLSLIVDLPFSTIPKAGIKIRFMGHTKKQQSNPFSTGSGGSHFEAHVQASFAALLLTGGFAPCFPSWPIAKIKLQGTFAEYETDDLIVFIGEDGEDRYHHKLLGQVKHAISITKSDTVFGEVIQAAWNDFNNEKLFRKNKDAFALITGPLSATDINDTRTILEWARHSENAEEFFKKVGLTRFSSKQKREKLQAFREQLNKANSGVAVSDERVFEFLKHFYLLGYDLDLKAGVTLSLLHSLIGRHTKENPQSLWARIVDEVMSANKNAGTISLNMLPDDLVAIFRPPQETRPESFPATELLQLDPTPPLLSYTPELVAANLLGAWDENKNGDVAVIQTFAPDRAKEWLKVMRETLQQPESPFTMRNGKWRITDRRGFWQASAPQVFDEHLDAFAQCAVTILRERGPQFDLPVEERYAATLHGKRFQHSSEMREGVAQTLALLGTDSASLTHCSTQKPESTVRRVVRKVLESSDWVLWASLDPLLPTLAEASPEEFLEAVETTITSTPNPFKELFAQESNGIGGRNYLTGLLWALETLAWDEKYLTRVCVLLAELAAMDPGGNWANRPSNSLTLILLPWHPQTTAPFKKHHAALKAIRREAPEVAWKLLIELLPNQMQTSRGTHKPIWRPFIPADWQKGVTRQAYWEQVTIYSEAAYSMAEHDVLKLSELIKHLKQLPSSMIEKLLGTLAAADIAAKPEIERMLLWDSICTLVTRHRRLKNGAKVLEPELLDKLEAIAKQLAPTDPFHLYQRLFSGREHDLYEESGNWEAQRQALDDQRFEAVKEIFAQGQLEKVIQFAESISRPYLVGYALGKLEHDTLDKQLLPDMLQKESRTYQELLRGYISQRYQALGWAWAEGVHTADWPQTTTVRFLTYLPFVSSTWERVQTWLSDSEGEYWRHVSVAPYEKDEDTSEAIDKLIKYGRPHAAINCLGWQLHHEQPLDIERSVKALLAAISSSESDDAIDQYEITELIKALQENPGTNVGELIQVEWAYVALLERYFGAIPKTLEQQLSVNPELFCTFIKLVYTSTEQGASPKEYTAREQAQAENAWKLLSEWHVPPGTLTDGSFSGEDFRQWLERVKTECAESGHLEVALQHVGNVLIYCPPDSDGLWIPHTVAEALNAKDAADMREGYSMGFFNSRGVHYVDPTGAPEKALAETYREKADAADQHGYQRLAATMRELGERYDREVKLIIEEHSQEDENA